MDIAPQPEQIAILHVVCCAFVASAGASLSCLDRETKIRDMVKHVALSLFLGILIFFTIKAFWPKMPWYGSLLPCGLIGLLISGIAVGLRNADNSLGGVIPKIVKDRLGVKEKSDGNQ